MSIDAKIRIGLLVVSVAIPALATFAALHGFMGPLDPIGGTSPL
jgi:hypothetical protein